MSGPIISDTSTTMTALMKNSKNTHLIGNATNTSAVSSSDNNKMPSKSADTITESTNQNKTDLGK